MHLWWGKESTWILSAREGKPSLLRGHHCDHLSHRVSGHVCPEQPRKDTLWKHSVLSVCTTPLCSTQPGHRESTVHLQPTVRCQARQGCHNRGAQQRCSSPVEADLLRAHPGWQLRFSSHASHAKVIEWQGRLPHLLSPHRSLGN